jgi:acyl dehydratase
VPIDPSAAIGADLGSRIFSWTESDVLLYHLGVGAGSREGDNLSPAGLRYTLDGPALQVLPSFAVVAPTFHETGLPALDLPGCDINLAQVVHGSQAVSVSGPLPTSGTATLSTKLTDIWDKGKAAVIWQESVAHSTAPNGGQGEELWRARSSIFVKGEGGWGGGRGTTATVVLPEREPDLLTSYDVTPQQALLYRLCGDRNPLHADPDFAKAAGFPAPILHGLCSYGIVLRELTDGLLDRDATTVRAFTGRFAGVVFPGESIRVAGWREDGQVVAAATIAGGDRAGSPVLADCVLTL